MKIKAVTYFLILFLFSSLISGQIIITQSDFTSVYKIGNTFKNFSDTSTTSIDIGNTGGGNAWDFSGLIPQVTFETNYISPSGTPFESTFSGAGIANHFILTYDSSGTTETSETWNYFSSTDGKTLGSGTIITSTNGSSVDSSTSVTKHFPPFLEFDFPIEANKNWSKKDSSETMLNTSGGSFTTVVTTVYNIKVDAWGTMKLPSGNSYEALRLREQSTSTTFLLGIPIFSSSTVDYFFISKTGESLSISTESDNPPSSGIVSGTIGWSENNVTSVEKLDAIPNQFVLQQNYPNPFNPTTTLKYSIPKQSHVNLKVYNLLGKEVASLVNNLQSAGVYKYSFDASNLSSGIYFVSLQAGDFLQVRKMTLLK